MTVIGIPDLLQRMKEPVSVMRMAREAKEHKRSLSAWLEHENPTEKADTSGLDAFGRMLREADIVVRTIEDEGIYADEFGDFIERGGRAMFHEYAWRQYRKAAQPQQRATVASTLDAIPGSVMRPYADFPEIIMDNFQPAVPITEVLAGSRGVSAADVRAVHLVEPVASAKRWVRVGETSEIPLTTIALSTHSRSLLKFGRGLAFSYEVLRREPIDRIQPMIQLMSVQNQTDKLAAIIDILVNGDGNTNSSATSYSLSTLDVDAAGLLTFKAWISFRSKFKNPYAMTTALAREAVAVALQLINSGSANLPVASFPVPLFNTDITPINSTLSGGIRFGITDDAPANKILGLDRRVAVERIYEIGSEIQETERFVSNQTEAIFFTENETYMIRNAQGVKVLDLAT